MTTKCMLSAVFAASMAFAQAQTPADAPLDAVKLKTDLDRATRTLQDWPALKRYRDANATVAAPAAGEERVVFMGDSITDGWGKRYGQFFPGKPYINRGISGQTTPQMLVRCRPQRDLPGLHTPMLDDKGVFKQELTYDGLHPNSAGYEIMMPLAQKAIDQALGK